LTDHKDCHIDQPDTYYFDWDTVHVNAPAGAKNITISVSGQCPVMVDNGIYQSQCNHTHTFSWTGATMPINLLPEFQPIKYCPNCLTEFNPPLLPDGMRKRSKLLWWRIAKEQEMKDIRDCLREDENRGQKKADRKGRSRKRKRKWQPGQNNINDFEV